MASKASPKLLERIQRNALGFIIFLTIVDKSEAIIGGTLAEPNEFPYQVSLNRDGHHICSGAIINSVEIFTAAHCVNTTKPPYTELVVRTGSIDHNAGEVHAVKDIIIYSRFSLNNDSEKWQYDFAVIKLVSPITFNVSKSPIKLMNSPPIAGTSCVLSGWGKNEENGTIPQYLYKMNTSLLNNSFCKELLGGKFFESNLCTVKQPGIGASQGDSGAPLVCNGKLYGIVAFIRPYGLVPDTYINVHTVLLEYSSYDNTKEEIIHIISYCQIIMSIAAIFIFIRCIVDIVKYNKN